MKLQLCVLAALVASCVCDSGDKKKKGSTEPHVVTSVATLTFEVKNWDGEGETLRGDVKIGLFGDIVPMTTLNFGSICEGIKRDGKARLQYKNTQCHRLVKDMLVQCGDIISGDGTGSRSIFGERFVDENFKVSHATAGIVSMANHGKDTNGSQFFILFGRARYLDGSHVAFGKVLEGMDVLEDINTMGPFKDRAVPKQKVRIADCSVEHLEQKYELPEKVLLSDDPSKA
ncbi:peptidyl-prolyl cis-trans isomerase H-like [Haliotis rufescens]|uniref:peptidyl-prolyl cis-trans isomerase H-like n=1 Tax=Haliotis rufescens TaxID=6454 RepID=UPI00201F8A9B|nr:peptidyl-prolyl cis-trans isomerase H-like [Haliotis rufescens]